ncbi:sulfatase [Planctomyces sp. SCGC AG-212-M04]|nr:sulfatase [Planctomyces sp. SCGC AG-212-M04]
MKHLICIVAAIVAAASPLPSSAADKPNFLWLVAEDFGPELACYGTKQVFSPNLDALAASGMRYTRAYSTAPVCSASRSAFMTGMYQTTIGAHNHRSHRDDGYELPIGVKVVTNWFRDAGYFTANVRELPASFGFKGTGKTDWNFTHEEKPFDGADWNELKAHQPFVAQINFQETHRKFHAPEKADPKLVEIPPYYPDHEVTRKDWAQYLDAASELDRKVGLILEQLEKDSLTKNTVVIFTADHGQAHVRGKQFCYEEGLHVPLIIRWPAGLATPKGYSAGTVSDRFIESIDIAPTILALGGGTKPAGMQGQVFLGDKSETPRKYAFGARDRCDETVFRLRTVRDDRYRYIRNFMPERPFLQKNDYKERSYPVWNLLKELHAQGKLTPAQEFLCQPTMPAEELYDLQADPHEIKNLADSKDPAHAAKLKELRGVLEKWIEETNDQGKTLEPKEVAEAEGVTKSGGQPNAAANKKRKK